MVLDWSRIRKGAGAGAISCDPQRVENEVTTGGRIESAGAHGWRAVADQKGPVFIDCRVQAVAAFHKFGIKRHNVEEVAEAESLLEQAGHHAAHRPPQLRV